MLNVCVALPSSPGCSETFLQAHVDNFAGKVAYLEDFPLNAQELFPNRVLACASERLKRQLRVCWHHYLVNPIKKSRLKKFFKDNNISVVLAEYGFTGVPLSKLCRDVDIPLVVHFHGYDAYQTNVVEQYKTAYQKMFEYSSGIVAVSRHMASQLLRLGAPEKKIFINPYGVQISKFAGAQRIKSSVVISVGRFVEKKAPYLTIIAFKRVLEKQPEAKLVMVGDGALYDVCSQLTKALHIEHAVELKAQLRMPKLHYL
jgi:glycosyltransferase involved in cell wall biosynthesis